MNTKKEIKFRVWDNVDTMHGPYTLHDLQSPRRVEFTSDCPVMQFTGMKDRGDKDIYEGDIVAVDGIYDPATGQTETELRVAQYIGPSLSLVEYITNEGESRTDVLFVHDILGGGIEKDDIFEVVGNIYETPEIIAP
jgi:uncharacterized phage protein (TIGR01671 family)